MIALQPIIKHFGSLLTTAFVVSCGLLNNYCYDRGDMIEWRFYIPLPKKDDRADRSPLLALALRHSTPICAVYHLIVSLS
jgi:hypothetical protein